MTETPHRRFWEQVGGASDYDAEWKKKILKHVSKILRKQNISIGNTVLDLGSGPKPISQYIVPKESKVLYVDFNAPIEGHAHAQHLHINRDIRDVLDQKSTAAIRSRVRAAKFLGIDAHNSQPEQVDTAIVSDVLNYIPAEETLRQVYNHLKKGGIMIILNKPDRTFAYSEHALHPKGAKSNEELTRFCKESLGMLPFYVETTKEHYLIAVFQK
ncbi:MAG TPA: class I SAM-dependent methyltransferase [Candidatus Paceibacterota bacterium]